MGLFSPKGDKVIIKQTDAESVSQGGIIIPDTAQEDTLYGEVIAVGPGAWASTGKRIPMETNVGDIVVFPKFGPMKFEYDEVDYIIARENDLLTGINADVEAPSEEVTEKTLLKG